MKIITERNDLSGVYVIVRTSCNVPLEDGEVRNVFRLKRALPTIQFLQEQGAKVVLIAHIGRDEQDTLLPVHRALIPLVPGIVWGGVVGSEECRAAHAQLQNGQVLLVENLRQQQGEVAADPAFAAELATLGSVYVNDAFDNIHRDHASMVLLPKLLPAYAGITLAEEVSQLQQVMRPKSPSLFIIGGAKFETKMPLVEKYLAAYDFVFVGGALANDVLKGQGYEVGVSLVSEVSLVDSPLLSHAKRLPIVDVVVVREGVSVTVTPDAVLPSDQIMDIGSATLAMLRPYIETARTILWNGPLGKYELGSGGSTQKLAAMIADSPAFSVLGGGDTVAAVEELGLHAEFGFVSIGGGAMLTYLEQGTTRALEALS